MLFVLAISAALRFYLIWHPAQVVCVLTELAECI